MAGQALCQPVVELIAKENLAGEDQALVTRVGQDASLTGSRPRQKEST